MRSALYFHSVSLLFCTWSKPHMPAGGRATVCSICEPQGMGGPGRLEGIRDEGGVRHAPDAGPMAMRPLGPVMKEIQRGTQERHPNSRGMGRTEIHFWFGYQNFFTMTNW